ncbi:MAG TPA: UbiA family prenyltransferase, partial [Solirubrobacteraceae bacterium]|nr:UbiA family prenyltransferase [Solirubrobacteraceae bacterium]
MDPHAGLAEPAIGEPDDGAANSHALIAEPQIGSTGARLPVGALLRGCRPRQWVKNVLVLAAPAAAGILGQPDVAGRVALTFVCFCMLSSATYLLNDVHDRHEDRRSPRNRGRPIASGELSVGLAVATALVL